MCVCVCVCISVCVCLNRAEWTVPCYSLAVCSVSGHRLFFLRQVLDFSFAAGPCAAWHNLNHQRSPWTLIVNKGQPWVECETRDTSLVICWQSSEKEGPQQTGFQQKWGTYHGNLSEAKNALRSGKLMFICNRTRHVWQHSWEDSHCGVWPACSIRSQVFFIEVFSLRGTKKRGRKTTIGGKAIFLWYFFGWACSGSEHSQAHGGQR